MSKAAKTHWGQWVAARSEALGYKRQQDLAEEVGCTRDRIARWTAMAEPPRHMRKGFAQALARALKTTRQTVFMDYVRVSPERPPESWALANHDVPWRAIDWNEVPDDEKLRELITYIGPEHRRYFAVLFAALADARQQQLLGEILDAEMDGNPRPPAGPKQPRKPSKK